jgi:hypothetical protein
VAPGTDCHDTEVEFPVFTHELIVSGTTAPALALAEPLVDVCHAAEAGCAARHSTAAAAITARITRSRS